MATKRKNQNPIILEKPRSITFDVQNAIDYGQEEAIVIEHFIYWIEANLARNINFHDGRTWTYNTHQELTSELKYPFWSPKQIFRIINSLEKQGVLLKGNYNKRKGDQTLWYAFQDEAKWLNLKNAPQRTENSQIPKQKRPPNKRSKKVAPTDSQMGMADSQMGMADSQMGMADSQMGNALPITTNNSSLNSVKKHNNSTPENSAVINSTLLSLVLTEKKKAEALAELNQLSVEQRELAIAIFNHNVANKTVKRTEAALINWLINQGKKGLLEPINSPTITSQSPAPKPSKPAEKPTVRRNITTSVRKAVENARNNELAEMSKQLHTTKCINLNHIEKGLIVFYDEIAKAELLDLFNEPVVNVTEIVRESIKSSTFTAEKSQILENAEAKIKRWFSKDNYEKSLLATLKKFHKCELIEKIREKDGVTDLMQDYDNEIFHISTHFGVSDEKAYDLIYENNLL